MINHRGGHTMRAVTIKDLYQFRFPSHPKLSPDGQWVIYEKTHAREAENDHKTELWLASMSEGSARTFTSDGTVNRGAIWSPDGKYIAYLSNRSEGTQLWIQSVENNEAEKITAFHYPLSQLQYAPDGQTIYGLLPVKDELALWTDRSSALHTNQPSERTYESLYYKFDGLGFNDGSKKQIVAIDVKTKEYRMLTDGTQNIESFSVSPDGQSLVCSVVDIEDVHPLYNGAIYTLDVSTGEYQKLTDEPFAKSPVYSPDGKWVAFIAGDIHQKLYVVPAEGGEAICLSEDYPGTFANMIYSDAFYYKAPWAPEWSDDSRYIYVLSGFQGTNEIVRFAADGSEDPMTVVGGPRVIMNFSFDGHSKFVIAYIAPNTPGRVSLVTVDEANKVVRKTRQLTEELVVNDQYFPKDEVYLDDCNHEFLANVKVVEPETLTYESVDGWKIHGFLLKPADFEPGKKYPVVLDIHGGPHSTHGYAYFHQLQLYAAKGYAVIYVNPRGSSGYGQEFAEAVLGIYGTKDMEDILNGVDYALAQYDFLDESQVAVTGLSYGGFMTNWIVTHTDRFKVAITEGSICNWISMHGTSDISPGFIEREFKGQTSFEELWEKSPLKYVDQVKTPILIVHAEDDIRVPIEQSEQFYSYIKRQGKVARFVRIPECTHVMLQNGAPDKKEARLSAMLDWLAEHMPTE